jgi:hypothetical protein
MAKPRTNLSKAKVQAILAKVAKYSADMDKLINHPKRATRG